MLLNLVAVLTIVGLYATELRGHPRTTAGGLMLPTALSMATTTYLTTEDAYRLNLSTNRPPVSEAADQVADYYRQHGLSGPDLQQETGTVLGTFATVESVAVGFQWGLRFLSLMMLTLGLVVALPLWRSARGLRAPPGAGYN